VVLIGGKQLGCLLLRLGWRAQYKGAIREKPTRSAFHFDSGINNRLFELR
jgi:hypothetical protein